MECVKGSDLAMNGSDDLRGRGRATSSRSTRLNSLVLQQGCDTRSESVTYSRQGTSHRCVLRSATSGALRSAAEIRAHSIALAAVSSNVSQTGADMSEK
jgi:hypothetical protein